MMLVCQVGHPKMEAPKSLAASESLGHNVYNIITKVVGGGACCRAPSSQCVTLEISIFWTSTFKITSVLTATDIWLVETFDKLLQEGSVQYLDNINLYNIGRGARFHLVFIP